MNDPARGFQGHGKIAFFYTKDQYQELCRKEVVKMETLLSAQQDDFSEGDEEAAELAQEAHVSFGNSVEILGVIPAPRATDPDAAAKRARLSLQAQTAGRRPHTARTSPVLANTDHVSFYGLEDPQEKRWIFHDFNKVRSCLDEHGFLLREVFPNSAAAKAWKASKNVPEDDSL